MTTRRPDLPDPPGHLSPAAQAWWTLETGRYELDPHLLKLLELAGNQWDVWQRANGIIAEKGLTFQDGRGSPRKRPEVSIAKEAAIAFSRLVREIGLDLGEPEPPRSNAIRGRRRS